MKSLSGEASRDADFLWPPRAGWSAGCRRRPRSSSLASRRWTMLSTRLMRRQTAIEAALRAADFDPNELERAEARLFALRGMARKYSAPVAQLPALAEKYAADLAALDAGRAKVAALGEAAKKARRDYSLAAAALSKARQSSCARIGKGGGRRTCAAEAGARALHRRDHQAIPTFCRRTGSTGWSFACKPIRALARAH